MMDEKTTTTPLQNRTRNAILRAAITVFALNPGAPLSDIAGEAQVARSTLHRYFPERADLTEALRMYAKDHIAKAIDQARLDEGPASDALLRLGVAYFEAWDTIMWDYMETQEISGQDHEPDEINDAVTALIERGYADGSIDPAMPSAWIQHALYSMVYTAWDYAREGRPRHEAAMLCEASMRKIIAPSATG